MKPIVRYGQPSVFESPKLDVTVSCKKMFSCYDEGFRIEVRSIQVEWVFSLAQASRTELALLFCGDVSNRKQKQ